MCVCVMCERYGGVCESEMNVFEMSIWVCVCVMGESDMSVCV